MYAQCDAESVAIIILAESGSRLNILCRWSHVNYIIVEQKIMLSILSPVGIIIVTSYFCQSLNQTLCMLAQSNN